MIKAWLNNLCETRKQDVLLWLSQIYSPDRSFFNPIEDVELLRVPPPRSSTTISDPALVSLWGTLSSIVLLSTYASPIKLILMFRILQCAKHSNTQVFSMSPLFHFTTLCLRTTYQTYFNVPLLVCVSVLKTFQFYFSLPTPHPSNLF